MRKSIASLAFAVLVVAGGAAAADEKDNNAGPYVPTPWPIVDELLKLADIGPADVLYDLGSGDGRLVMTAARHFGARGVGVELQQSLVDEANARARVESLADRVRFVQADLFEFPVAEASVVTLYLLPRFVTRLVPKLRAELQPGARVVSHDYPLSPWPPDKTLTFDVDEKEPISGSKRTVLYYYVVPARVGGLWEISSPELGRTPIKLEIGQSVESLEGVAYLRESRLTLRDPVVRGGNIRFGLFAGGRLLDFTGKVSSDSMTGEVFTQGAGNRGHWIAQRLPGAR